MKRIAIVVAGAVSLIAAASFAGDAEQRVADSRTVVKELMQMLKGELEAAMKAGGPVNAIQVCNTRAPEIAASFSERKGWTVRRTSLKLRNPNNAPDAWEKRVLEQFEEHKAGGADPKTLEYSEVVEENGKAVFRYMKAIPTGELCLNCHGAALEPEIAGKLKELYPNDRATGFKIGDIRGAFSVSQPM